MVKDEIFKMNNQLEENKKWVVHNILEEEMLQIEKLNLSFLRTADISNMADNVKMSFGNDNQIKGGYNNVKKNI